MIEVHAARRGDVLVELARCGQEVELHAALGPAEHLVRRGFATEAQAEGFVADELEALLLDGWAPAEPSSERPAPPAPFLEGWPAPLAVQDRGPDGLRGLRLAVPADRAEQRLAEVLAHPEAAGLEVLVLDARRGDLDGALRALRRAPTAALRALDVKAGVQFPDLGGLAGRFELRALRLEAEVPLHELVAQALGFAELRHLHLAGEPGDDEAVGDAIAGFPHLRTVFASPAGDWVDDLDEVALAEWWPPLPGAAPAGEEDEDDHGSGYGSGYESDAFELEELLWLVYAPTLDDPRGGTSPDEAFGRIRRPEWPLDPEDDDHHGFPVVAEPFDPPDGTSVPG